jgi:hypothetical protein
MNSISQYKWINLGLALVLVWVFIYPIFILDTSQALSCTHVQLIGKICNSCGLSRDFRNILNGLYWSGDAAMINRQSLKVFIFFLVLFLSRFIIYIKPKTFSLTVFLILDILLHLILGINAFLPFY